MTGAAIMETAAATPLDKAKAFAAQRHQLFIGGRWVDPVEGRRFDTFDPATTRRLGEIAQAGAAAADAAVGGARGGVGGPERGGV